MIENPIDEFAQCDRKLTHCSSMREEPSEAINHHLRDDSSVEMPCWARDLGLDRKVFCLLIETSMARGVAPTELIREWVNERAQDSLS